MRKKSGFTLVELIGVLVIIGLLVVVVSTPILGQIRNQKKQLKEATAKILYASVETYLDDNINLFPKNEGMVYYVSVLNLIEEDYLKKDFIESSNDILTNETIIEIKIERGGYSFELDSHDKSLDTVYSSMKNDNMYSYLNGKYFKGNITNNYVYYSGILWRIMGKNFDGTIRMIADEPVTTLFFSDSQARSFQESYANEWLNNYFVSRLSYNNIIVRFPWCQVETTNINNVSDSCKDMDSSKMYKSKVGLLTLEEYNLSLSSGETYINNDIRFITSSQRSGNDFYYIDDEIGYSRGSEMYFIKPVINVRKETVITSGEGSKNKPYILNKNIDIDYTYEKTLSNLNIAPGEYIEITVSDAKINYRVVDRDNSSLKIIRDGIIDNPSLEGVSFNTNNAYSSSAGIGDVLNNSLYNTLYPGYFNIIKTSMWFQGDSGHDSYKFTSLAKTNYIYGVKVGLPKIAEIMTIPFSEDEYWTMSKADNTKLYTLTKKSINEVSYEESKKVRDVIILNIEAVVKSGSGTKEKPYVLKSE